MNFHVQRDNKDVDNMEKLVLDILSDNLVYSDDIWVVQVVHSKHDAAEGCTNIEVTTVE
eukprot:CAMPEP_0178918336 /NCGR_PEP_ID=MMETSP0786-20121207/13774_1 /TAXON_ID=186022 /ORGANISM="Thalassionema frauenfeldii, Strain CCMP 1798" /LENGTH=58 /DNA_ID=CAMNT_0020592043 /DNA_START=412 /DNA_END=585 /DNA_ORIENTATION=+